MSVVACKACGKELGKGVKKCIHCGADQRNFFAKHKIITGILVLVLVSAVGSALSGGGGSDKTADGNATASGASQKSSNEGSSEGSSEQRIGKAFKSGNVQVTVVSVETRQKVGSEFVEAKPAEGGVYVAVVWKYKNVGDEPIGMFSQPSLKLVDPKGVEYDADVSASSSFATERKLTEKIVSDLNPGITVTAAEVFEVAKESYNPKTWKVLVKADDDIKVEIK